MSCNSSSSAECPKTQSRSKVSAAAFSKSPYGTTRMPTARCWRSSLARKSMFGTPSRKNPGKAARRRSRMGIESGSDTRKQRSLQNMRKRKAEIEEGSGNVFADLGLKDSDELFARAQIGFCVYKIVKARKLKQKEIAKLLGIAQPDVSHLMNGHYSRFTTDKLLDFLKRLDRKVTIQIGPR